MPHFFKDKFIKLFNISSIMLNSVFKKTVKNESFLCVLFSYRYDKKYVIGLISNVVVICDAFVTHDDTKNSNLWYHEGRTRIDLIEKARRVGAIWVLCLDPDERIAKSDLPKIRNLMNKFKNQKVIFEFPFREMWSNTEYRVDGIWATKSKRVMFPMLPGQNFQCLRLHSAWCPINSDYKIIKVDVPIYHLKMMNKKDRIKRAQVYNKIDPERVYQSIGYDYLIDETAIKLAQAPKDLFLQ